MKLSERWDALESDVKVSLIVWIGIVWLATLAMISGTITSIYGC